jgi:hypothetical protein
VIVVLVRAIFKHHIIFNEQYFNQLSRHHEELQHPAFSLWLAYKTEVKDILKKNKM